MTLKSFSTTYRFFQKQSKRQQKAKKYKQEKQEVGTRKFNRKIGCMSTRIRLHKNRWIPFNLGAKFSLVIAVNNIEYKFGIDFSSFYENWCSVNKRLLKRNVELWTSNQFQYRHNIWLKKSSKKVKYTLVKSSQAGLCPWQYFASFPKSKDTYGKLFVNSIFLGKTNMEHSLSLVVLAVSLGAPSGILLSGSPTFEYNLHIVLHISFVVHQIWFYVFAIRDKWNDLLES